jgi:hypothetical protein
MSGNLITAGPLHDAHAALVARLAAFFPPAQFASAEVPARLTPQGWARILRRTPFVGLGWRGVAPDRQVGRLLRGQSQWAVFLSVRNEHALGARLTGTPQGPGLYGMVQVAAAALHGWTIAGLGAVAMTGIENVTIDGWDDEATAIAALTLDIGFALDHPAAVAGLDEFLRAGAVWEFDADPATARATDLYTVRAT